MTDHEEALPECEGCPCEHRYQEGMSWERSRLVRLAHAIEDEGLPLTAATFNRLAYTVMETGPLEFSSEPTDSGVRWRMDQSVRFKDLRNV